MIHMLIICSNLVKLMAFPTSTLLVILSLLVATCTMLWRRRGHLRLPPGPRGLPIVGYIPYIRPESFHHQLAQLAKTYGPIMSLRLGAKLSVVITSPAIAREVLRSQDAIFANRDPPAVANTFTYGCQDLIWSPNGPLWRLLRKLTVRDIMAPSRLDACIPSRQFELRRMLHRVMEMAGSPVDLDKECFLTALNSIMSMLWGGSLEGEDRESVGSEFGRVVKGTISLGEATNISDFFPLLAKFDLQGINREAEKRREWINRTIDDVVKERMKKNMEGEGVEKQQEGQDVLQLLLTFLEEEGEANNFNVTHLRCLLIDMFFAGVDSTSNTISWAMAELLCNPQVLKKAQQEIDAVVGKDELVEDRHLPQLHYIKAVIKEAMRLHTVVPLLLPHSPSETCTVNGYTIPKNTQILVNAWAIHRDPQLWNNALEFQPERFLSEGSDFGLSGNDLKYFPFGSGRRLCAGLNLADRLTTHILASLLHASDWKLPEGEKLDMTEQFGFVLKKATPLVAIPTPRLSNKL